LPEISAVLVLGSINQTKTEVVQKVDNLPKIRVREAGSKNLLVTAGNMMAESFPAISV
jgi:hypothetical protein